MRISYGREKWANKKSTFRSGWDDLKVSKKMVIDLEEVNYFLGHDEYVGPETLNVVHNGLKYLKPSWEWKLSRWPRIDPCYNLIIEGLTIL